MPKITGGVLSLLALAARCGALVDGHFDAMARICDWLDQWRHDTPSGTTWPFWVNRPQHESGKRDAAGPQRLGWCYGTIGLARAQQLAGIAIGDAGRQHLAEEALVQALAGPARRVATPGPSLCHGNAGLAHLAAVAGTDASPAVADQLNAALPGLLKDVQPADSDPECAATRLLEASEYGPGLLEGASGIALAVLAPSTTLPALSGWDTCLLIA